MRLVLVHLTRQQFSKAQLFTSFCSAAHTLQHTANARGVSDVCLLRVRRVDELRVAGYCL